SGAWYQHWRYDDRSRVVASLYGSKSASADLSVVLPGRAQEAFGPSDFRTAQVRATRLDAATRAALQDKGIDPATIEPATANFSEQAGHKIRQMTKGSQVRPFAYQGAQRIDDGRFTYEFDVKGRLVQATEKLTVGPIRRIVYTYSGTGRLV